MNAHHLFIFTDAPDAAAQELLDFGLLEGSNRVHPGQGTSNRKFYFQNFYLELLWVSNQEEIKSALTAPAKLWERANHKTSGFSPFGICLENTPETDAVFTNCLHYQPVYLPPGMAIEVVTNEHEPYLPWLFRLPKLNYPPAAEPINHTPNIKQLTGVVFEIPGPEYTEYSSELNNEFVLQLKPAAAHRVRLQFDNRNQGPVKTFSTIPLTIEY